LVVGCPFLFAAADSPTSLPLDSILHRGRAKPRRETSCRRSHSAIARSYHPHSQYTTRRGPVREASGPVGSRGHEVAAYGDLHLSCGVARRTTPVAEPVQHRCHVMNTLASLFPPRRPFSFIAGSTRPLTGSCLSCFAAVARTLPSGQPCAQYLLFHAPVRHCGVLGGALRIHV
jgi:hypothetical protein